MPPVDNTSVATLIRLTQVYGFDELKQRNVWINPAQIAWLAEDRLGTLIQLAGEERPMRVVEPALEVVWRIEQGRP